MFFVAELVEEEGGGRDEDRLRPAMNSTWCRIKIDDRAESIEGRSRGDELDRGPSSPSDCWRRLVVDLRGGVGNV